MTLGFNRQHAQPRRLPGRRQASAPATPIRTPCYKASAAPEKPWSSGFSQTAHTAVDSQAARAACRCAIHWWRCAPAGRSGLTGRSSSILGTIQSTASRMALSRLSGLPGLIRVASAGAADTPAGRS